MISIEYYRAEAERCHQLAEGSKDSEEAARWRALSRSYHTLADELEAAEPPTSLRTSMQQPVQQQQRKSEPKDKN
jgi:hypothetical protein